MKSLCPQANCIMLELSAKGVVLDHYIFMIY